MSQYKRLDSGEEQIIKIGDIVHLACCDCGMVHKMLTAQNTETGELAFVLFRDNRATAQLRRHEYGNLHKDEGKWKIVRAE